MSRNRDLIMFAFGAFSAMVYHLLIRKLDDHLTINFPLVDLLILATFLMPMLVTWIRYVGEWVMMGSTGYYLARILPLVLIVLQMVVTLALVHPNQTIEWMFVLMLVLLWGGMFRLLNH